VGLVPAVLHSGSPQADIVIVSEAPTWSEGSDETVYSMTRRTNDRGESFETLCKFWREYPFTDDLSSFGFPTESRHRLYRQYVDKLLSFLEDPNESVGFADIVKRPLEGGEDARDALSGSYEFGLTLKRQLEYLNQRSLSATIRMYRRSLRQFSAGFLRVNR
jgi:hypothetical protein